MRNVAIRRMTTTDHGTVGIVSIDGKFFGYSMERPERANKSNISCIPAGEYIVEWHRSPKYGRCFQVTSVEGRSHILIHPGNFGGDTLLGFRSDTNGCILLGKHLGTLTYNMVKQKAVLVSRPMVRKFNAALKSKTALKRKPFQLTITREYKNA